MFLLTMYRPLHVGLVLFLSLVTWVVSQAYVPGSAEFINGNWYCSSIKAITYTNFPDTGHYNKITHMDPSSGECTQQRHDYSGSLAPLNEEVGA